VAFLVAVFFFLSLEGIFFLFFRVLYWHTPPKADVLFQTLVLFLVPF
jgi:hypothetical protein